jgi:hypothetical protein
MLLTGLFLDGLDGCLARMDQDCVSPGGRQIPQVNGKELDEEI